MWSLFGWRFPRPVRTRYLSIICVFSCSKVLCRPPSLHTSFAQLKSALRSAFQSFRRGMLHALLC
eukprot:scaffold846_cov252-Pinguiococcus_pyrenoidosus.AAC.26